jgi:hypothetical protein
LEYYSDKISLSWDGWFHQQMVSVIAWKIYMKKRVIMSLNGQRSDYIFFLKWVNSEVRLDYDKLKFNGLKNSWGPISLGLIQGNGLPFLRPA